MNKNAKIYIIILGICAFWLFGIPFIFAKVVSVVCENISFNTNYKVEIEKPRLRLNIIPIAVIKADKVKIIHRNSEESIYLEKPSASIRLLPLLSGKIHINKIFVSDLNADTTLKKEFVLEKDIVNKLENSKIQCDCLHFEKFIFKINQNNKNQQAIYSGKEIYYRKNGRYININIDSNINMSGHSSDFKAKLFLPKNNDINKSVIDINLSNIDISPLKDYLKNYLPKDLKDLRGIININVDKNHLSASLNNTAVIMQDEAKSLIFPDKMSIKSDFSLTRKTLNIISSEISGGNINANVSGTILNYIDKSRPVFNLSIQLNKSKVEDIIKLMPPIKTEDIDVYKLKKYKFYGDALGNFSVKGDNVEPSVYGNLYINNGILTKPIPNAKGATIKLSFLGKYVNYDVVIPAGKLEKVWIKGTEELYNVKYSDMRVWSSENVNLSTVREKIVPLHEILDFVIGPVPIMSIDGIGNIDITIKGNRSNPHIWGNFNAKNVTANFNEIPDMILYDADAKLTFNDENIAFVLNKGFVNNREVNIKGTSSVSGRFDFDIVSEKQELKYLYNALKTSAMIDDLKNVIPNIDVIEGLADLKLKVYGNLKYIEDLKINENCFYKGQLNFLNNAIGIKGINISNINGYADFEGNNIDSKTTSKIGKSVITSNLIIKNNLADLDLNIQRLNLADVLKFNKNIPENLTNIFTNISLKYKGSLDKIEQKKIDFNSEILSSDKHNTLQMSGGQIILKNGKLNIKNLKGHFLDTDSSFDINLETENISDNAQYTGTVNLKNFELSVINLFGECALIPGNIRNIIKNFRFEKGKINLNAVIKNNNINASTNIGGIELNYTPLGLPIKVINGSLYSRKNFLGLDKINLLADGMPILIDGGINNFLTKPDIDIYINSKPKQEFIDKYINNNHIYPIKIKGDIIYWTKLKGRKDNINVRSEATLAPESSFYYLGAFVGDIENAIVLNIDMNIIKQNLIKIREFSYDKIIYSLSKRQTKLNMLKAKGGIDIYEKYFVFHDMKIKTSKPTDARIFNIIFKKPNIKQGQFTSDLRIDGNSSNPNVSGNFHIFETNIPFLDTVLKNISCVFNDKTINITSSGEILGNEITFKGVLKNKLSKPYYIENAELYTKVIDLNYLTNKLKMSQVDDYQGLSSFENFRLSDIVIRNIKMTANGIKLRNLIAENVQAKASLNENQLLDISSFLFNIANGTLSGNFKYNFQNDKTRLYFRAKDINANDITYAMFDLNNQIYGDLTGETDIYCEGGKFNKCLETLNGSVRFSVSDGKMPKLGSLEYLLKASNLLKGGVTGISINSLIDIITPLKTGNFSNIIGEITVKNGIADDIEISTKGKDLNLFISGKYNFAESNAEMEVLGLLSKKISTMFGPIGNVSLNTLFNIIPGIDLTKDTKILENINKIPGIEFSEKSYRKFVAEIKGNINGDNYVKSFQWIN